MVHFPAEQLHPLVTETSEEQSCLRRAAVPGQIPETYSSVVLLWILPLPVFIEVGERNTKWFS